MDVTIIGTGHIGAGLGRAWARRGHRIKYGIRGALDDSVKALLDETGAEALPVTQAIAQAKIVVLAVPFMAVQSLGREHHWQGRIVVDCTNPVGPNMSLLFGGDDSGAEAVARFLEGARIVKSFNAQGAENLAGPVYDGVPAHNFYCGDDAAAKATVRQLILDVGFEPLDLGALKAARVLEPMTLLWFSAARSLGSRQVAFRMLKR